jgi:hypothetical protein
MNYSDLNKTQKRCIDAFIKLNPKLESQATITRPEVEELFFKLHAERANGGPKIGYPMWLVKGSKTSRGVYEFPAPKLDSTPTKATSKSKVTVAEVKVDEEDKEFFTNLKEYGIMETA